MENDGAVLKLPVDDEFWPRLMSGDYADEAMRRLGEGDGRMVSAYEMDADWPNWEMHPAGDEVLILLKGQATFLLETADGVRQIELIAGKTCIVPRGVWHTAKIAQPCTLLAITPGKGTQHKPVS